MVQEIHERPQRSVFYFAGAHASNMHDEQKDQSYIAHNSVESTVEERWEERKYAYVIIDVLAIPNQYITWLVWSSFFNAYCCPYFFMKVTKIWAKKLICMMWCIPNRQRRGHCRQPALGLCIRPMWLLDLSQPLQGQESKLYSFRI